ncbi:MAG: cbb3-type cytochrome oxidase assembly protein CcoS [Pseudomonadota bacterium]
MTVLGLLLPISVLLGLVGAAAFVWSVSRHQYDDLDGAAQRILMDDDPAPPPRDIDRPS